MPRKEAWLVLCGLLFGWGLLPASAGAQAFRRGNAEFNAIREVQVPPGKGYSVAVTEFFHHGQIAPDGRNLAVSTRGQQFMPLRLLQLGPGDFCRIAFQTVPGQSIYDVLYGGEAVAPAMRPDWTCTDGLLMETRQYKNCNLNSLDSIREAFQNSKLIGADYVDGVMHSFNPFAPTPAPFLTRYSGTLHIAAAAKYGFVISTQDAGFLLIDEKVIASAPGRHGPQRQARPELISSVQLSAGAHRFEFYHAASGPAAMMVAAWEVNPKEKDRKPQPVAIPAEVWRTAAIARLVTEPVATRENRVAPDFLVKIEGVAPLPDNSVPLIRVDFKDITSKTLTSRAKVQWDFGDGQSSDQSDATHVYLRPGLYTVKLAVTRPPKTIETVNRVYVERPVETRKERLYTLDDFLPMLLKYDPGKLDGDSLVQLVAAFDAKASAIEWGATSARREKSRRARRRGREVLPDDPPDQSQAAKEEAAARYADADRYYALAVNAGKTGLTGGGRAEDDEPWIRVARIVGPMARDRLGQSQTALEIWQAAAAKTQRDQYQAECLIRAADITINDLLKHTAAKPLLEAAEKDRRSLQDTAVSSMLSRVWGDYHASSGDGAAARKAYGDAERVFAAKRNFIERTAWRGAYNRSTEEFLRANEYARAAAEIHAWEAEFPLEKVEGQMLLMYARYWAGRQKYEQAIAMSEQLLNLNRDSPYADQILMLAATCESKRGQPQRALATLHSLVKDYPGSPLVPKAKEQIAKLDQAGQGKQTGKK